MKTIGKGLALFIFSSIVGLFLLRVQTSVRGPASLGSSEESVQSDLIHALTLNDYGAVSQLSLYSDQADLCGSWNTIEVTFRAEGIAYSGEPDRLVQTTQCEDGGFRQEWPQNLMEESGNIERVGVFQEAPESWAIESVKLDGPAGLKVMSGVQIYKQTGKVPLVQQAE